MKWIQTKVQIGRIMGSFETWLSHTNDNSYQAPIQFEHQCHLVSIPRMRLSQSWIDQTSSAYQVKVDNRR